MTQFHPVVGKIKYLLDQQGVKYQTFEHEAVRTSEEAAATRPEFSLAQGAKALLIRVKKTGVSGDSAKEFVQIVLPGDARFDSKKAKTILGAKDLRFATEEEVSELTDGVKPGGLPPFGNIFGLNVYVDQTLLINKEIIFNAGDRRYSIALKVDDYLAVVQPQIVEVV
jgi:Ala-tRNA(Pro) deacylase